MFENYWKLAPDNIFGCTHLSAVQAVKPKQHCYRMLNVCGVAGKVPFPARIDGRTAPHRSSMPPTISESDSGSAVARRAGSAVACEAVGVEDAPGVPARSTAKVDRLRQEKKTMRLRRRL